jgi:signal transduction histidine kinase
VQPVFEAIAERSNRLVEGLSSAVYSIVDDTLHLMAFTRTRPEADAALQAAFPLPLSETTWGDQIRHGEIVQIPDMELSVEWEVPTLRAMAQLRGFRAVLFVPLLRDQVAIGAISVTRKEPGAFAVHHVQLLQSFADQAVIAIGNVRLFDEVQAKTADLTESLRQQTATSEVLKVISGSPGELEPVFNSMLENAVSICDAQFGNLFLIDSDGARWEAGVGTPPKLAEYFTQSKSFRPTPGSHLDRVMRTKQVSHTADDTAEAVVGAAARLGGARSTVCVPMVKDDALVGTIFIYRTEVRPFTDKQIDLVKNFAAQAVIAIENTRLLSELRQRTDDLSESLQQQTATADVLQIISSSPGDLAPVFERMLENATQVCGAEFGSMNLVEDDSLWQAALYNVPAAFAEVRTNKVFRPHPQSVLAMAIRTKQVVHLPDMRTSVAYLERAPATVELIELGGARTAVTVPMLREDEVIGAMTIYRQEVRPFGDKQIELLSNFAKQAVIAIENARLLKELRQRTADLSRSLDELRTAQDRLVQTEKLASLGQLTAGIAHEIKNPLNFVNNFSALSAELTDELNDVLKPVGLDTKVRKEVDELTGLLKDNLEKVVQHGKRADSIVKNMLLHSREGSGELRPSDINALLDESLNLAYHGARAEKPGFNITLQRDFDPVTGSADVYPQEITRVLLNLISNGFYAATRRAAETGDGFQPTLQATTKNLGDKIEIRIRDNGMGIVPEVKEKIFNPFFTTKPAGEGTGLGLSMSHDIVVKQHGGTIDVDTAPGIFTEFIITLPRTIIPQKTAGGSN